MPANFEGQFAVVVSLREFKRLRGERARFADTYRHFLKTRRPREIGLADGFIDSTRSR